MRTISDIISDLGGAAAIEPVVEVSRWAVNKWPLAGINDRHWAALIRLSGGKLTIGELYQANRLARGEIEQPGDVELAMKQAIAGLTGVTTGLRRALAAGLDGLDSAADPDAATRIRNRLERVLLGEAGPVTFVIGGMGDDPVLIWSEPMADVLRMLADGRVSDAEETLDAMLMATEAA